MKLLKILKEISPMPPEDDSIGTMQYLIDRTQRIGQLVPNYRLNLSYKNAFYKLGNDTPSTYTLLGYDQNDRVILVVAYRDFLDGITILNVNAVPEIRGQGIGVRLYEELSNTLRVPIYSSSSQTPHSRHGIWTKLKEKYPDRITLYNKDTNEETKEFDINDVYGDWELVMKFLPA